MNYLIIKDNKITQASECKAIGEDVINFEVDRELFKDYCKNPQKYIYLEGEIVENPEHEKEQAKKERQRLDNLKLTRADVFEALILAKGLTKSDLRTLIEQDESIDSTTKALYLNRFDEALEFYRGYPLFDLLGEKLGITSEMLDEFFESKDWKKLIKEQMQDEETKDGLV